MQVHILYKKSGTRKPKPPEIPADPLAEVIASRQSDQTGMLKMRQQLDKLRLEMQRSIQVSRAKFNAARWKMINKSMDD